LRSRSPLAPQAPFCSMAVVGDPRHEPLFWYPASRTYRRNPLLTETFPLLAQPRLVSLLLVQSHDDTHRFPFLRSSSCARAQVPPSPVASGWVTSGSCPAHSPLSRCASFCAEPLPFDLVLFLPAIVFVKRSPLFSGKAPARPLFFRRAAEAPSLLSCRFPYEEPW